MRPGADPHPESVRGRLTYAAYRGLGGAMQRLPESVADAAAATVGLGLTVVRRDAKEMYARHLERALGTPVAPAERAAWTRRAFREYARYWLEGARLPAVDAATVRARMRRPFGYEYLQDGMAAGRGVIMALPHVGTWEWGGAWLALEGYPMTAVAETLEPPELFDWFVRQRQAMGLTIVPLDAGAGGALLRTLRAGGLVGLLCDRDIQGNGIEVEFFGERTTLPGGPATLALRTGAALLPTAVYSGPGRGHTSVIRPPLELTRTGSLRTDVTRLTQAVAHELEGLIRRAPEQWHLFQPNWPSDLAARPGTRPCASPSSAPTA